MGLGRVELPTSRLSGRGTYKFKPTDSRVLEEQALERQLTAADFLPTKEDKY
jgi:hypothetical protein